MIWGIVGFVMSAISYLFFRNRKRHSDTLKGIANVYETMNDVVSDTNACRFLILFTANGGGRPNVGARLHGSVLYEIHSESVKGVKEDWQRVHIDQEYADLLLKLDREGRLIIRTKEMSYSLLRLIYRRDGITCAYIFKIKAGKSKYYYGSIQTRDETETLDLATLDLAASKIKNIFKHAR